jgi:hypothetical protein
MIKLFVILSVITLIVVFLYFLYQTNKINKETDDLNNLYMDDSLDTFKLKCPPGYRFDGTSGSIDNCTLETNPGCDKVSGDCNGYCESPVLCNKLSESDCKPPCKWDNTTKCTGTQPVCINKPSLQYPELDLDNLPELKRNTSLGQAFQKRCRDIDASGNSTTYASEYDWEAIAPYCSHIKLKNMPS